MKFTQMLGAMSVAAGISAGAALFLWQYDLVAEFILDAAVLLAVSVFVAWLIILFYERVGPIPQRITLICAGVLLGMYLAISAAYFGGYIGYNYPASQARLATQSKQITELTGSLDNTKAALTSSQNQLRDAKRVMADPNAVTAPAYKLATSLKLEFDNAGTAQALDAQNVKWIATSVRQAVELPSAPAPPPQPQSACNRLIDPGCNSFSSPVLFPSQRCDCPPPGPTYQTSNALLLVLTFPYPIQASGLKFEPHGVVLPTNSILKLTEREAVIMFDTSPRNAVLDITVTEPDK